MDFNVWGSFFIMNVMSVRELSELVLGDNFALHW